MKTAASSPAPVPTTPGDPTPTDYGLVRLANGVYSVRSLAEGETFHPVIGPVAEAEALYCRQLRLAERLAGLREEFVVWDVGLGAAANALTVLRAARAASAKMRVISFDRTAAALRFGLEHAAALGYFTEYETAARALLTAGRCTFPNGPQPAHWELCLADFPTWLAQPAARRLPKPHLVMFDAFSPARNPAMWTQTVFAGLHRLLDPGRACSMATYSRSTLLRVSWLVAGFFVGTGQGTGEKEETTVAATRPELIAQPLDRRWLQRARRSTSAEPLWTPVYRQAPLTAETWERLRAHPQFG